MLLIRKCSKCGGVKDRVPSGFFICRPCQRLRNRSHYLNHKEKYKIHRRNIFEENPDKKRKQSRESYSRNKENKRAYQRKNKERIKQRLKEWRIKNKEHIKLWYKNRPPLYFTYSGILSRCYSIKNAAYKDYGGRGIKVCDRWRGKEGYTNFSTDMGLKPGPEYSIERINNDGNYEPSNCKWADRFEQAANKRKAKRISGEKTSLIDYKGKLVTLEKLSDITNIDLKVIIKRFNISKSTDWIINKNSNRCYFYKGSYYTIADLGTIAELDPRTIFRRIHKNNVPIEKAMLKQ